MRVRASLGLGLCHTGSHDTVKLFWTRHIWLHPCLFCKPQQKKAWPHTDVQKKVFFNKHNIFLFLFNILFLFLQHGPHRWTGEFHPCVGSVCLSFFFFSFFLNALLAARETWCRKSSSESLHMAPVAKETTDVACRPLVQGSYVQLYTWGLRSTWVKRLWRKENCYFFILFHIVKVASI